MLSLSEEDIPPISSSIISGGSDKATPPSGTGLPPRQDHITGVTSPLSFNHSSMGADFSSIQDDDIRMIMG